MYNYFTVLKYAVKDVSEGAEYEFRVAAINVSGAGEPSPPCAMVCARNPKSKYDYTNFTFVHGDWLTKRSCFFFFIVVQFLSMYKNAYLYLTFNLCVCFSPSETTVQSSRGFYGYKGREFPENQDELWGEGEHGCIRHEVHWLHGLPTYLHSLKIITKWYIPSQKCFKVEWLGV